MKAKEEIVQNGPDIGESRQSWKILYAYKTSETSAPFAEVDGAE